MAHEVRSRFPDACWPAWIAFDLQAVRPACPLLQAAFGCDYQLAHLFPTEAWILQPEEGLKIYPIRTPEMMVELAMMVWEKHGD